MSKPEGKWEIIQLDTYNDTCWYHMILHGMWDVFRILDQFDTTKTWDLFHRTASITLLTVVSHMEELRETRDKHTIDNLNWSGE